MIKIENKIGVFGAGGFGKETMSYLIDCLANSNQKIEEVAVFVVDDQWYTKNTVMGIPVIPRSEFSVKGYEILIAVGDPSDRRKIIESLPADTRYFTLIHPSAIISKFVEIGEGAIITPGTIVTCDIKIGKHAHLNLHTTVGHDCIIGDYFTTAPGVHISGSCTIDDGVYFGTNSSVREKINICKNVTIGMGAVVVKDITEAGIYIGSPAKRLERKKN